MKVLSIYLYKKKLSMTCRSHMSDERSKRAAMTEVFCIR